jgi:hypothetical protein
MTNLSENMKGDNINTLLECENCKKQIVKHKAMKIPECYFNGNKIFYVCNESCLKDFLVMFR